ncbi:Protein ERGIC-53-like [Saitoella coloradoensis]
MQLSTLIAWAPLLLASLSTAQFTPDTKLSLAIPLSDNNVKLNGEWDHYGSVSLQTDRLQLTPAKPNQVGAIWNKVNNGHRYWSAEATFRVSGEERGGNNGMAIWYTADRGESGPIFGSKDKWDGLALTFSTGKGGLGFVRGHLNDRSIEYSRLEDPSRQAFGSCAMKYRNTGDMVRVRIVQSDGRLRVETNGNLCFETNQVELPRGNYWGWSASSTDHPDTHELFTFKVIPLAGSDFAAMPAPPGGQEQGHFVPPPVQREAPVDTGATPGLTQQINRLEMQFSSLTRRMDSLQASKSLIDRVDNQLDAITRVVMDLQNKVGQGSGGSDAASRAQTQRVVDEVSRLTARLDSLEKIMREHTSSVLGSLPDTVTTAMMGIPQSAVGWSGLMFVFALQIAVLGGYAWFKRRLDSPKKYL